MKRFLISLVLSLVALVAMIWVTSPLIANAETRNTSLARASGEELASASGHYARARSLLIAAVREFDRATHYARPDLLVDGKEWRNAVLDRAEELEKVLAPQPRLTEGGVQFSPDTRLLSEAYRP